MRRPTRFHGPDCAAAHAMWRTTVLICYYFYYYDDARRIHVLPVRKRAEERLAVEMRYFAKLKLLLHTSK